MMDKAKATAGQDLSQLCGTAARLWWLKLGLVLVLVVISIFGEDEPSIKTFDVEFKGLDIIHEDSVSALVLITHGNLNPYTHDEAYSHILVTCTADGAVSTPGTLNYTVNERESSGTSPVTIIRPCNACGVWISISCSATNGNLTTTTPPFTIAETCAAKITSFSLTHTAGTDDQKLVCETQGYPNPSRLKISKEPSTTILAGFFSRQSSHVEHTFDPYDCSVTGLYRCDCDSDSRTIAVTPQQCQPVWCPNQPTSVQTHFGQTTILNLCLISSRQTSMYAKWYKNGELYNGTYKPEIFLTYTSTNQYTAQVLLLNVDGVWGLKVNYQIGSIHKSSTLHNFVVRLSGPPLCPNNLTVPEVGATWVRLLWKAPTNGPASKYILFYNASEDRHMMQTVMSSGDDTITLPDLQPSTHYLFQFVSFNKHSCTLDQAHDACPDARVVATTGTENVNVTTVKPPEAPKEPEGCALSNVVTALLATLIIVIIVAGILSIAPDLLVRRSQVESLSEANESKSKTSKTEEFFPEFSKGSDDQGSEIVRIVSETSV